MKIVVIMWILSLVDLSGQKIIHNGTVEECLQEALIFNAETKDALAGCYVSVKQPDYSDKGGDDAY